MLGKCLDEGAKKGRQMPICTSPLKALQASRIDVAGTNTDRQGPREHPAVAIRWRVFAGRDENGTSWLGLLQFALCRHAGTSCPFGVQMQKAQELPRLANAWFVVVCQHERIAVNVDECSK